MMDFRDDFVMKQSLLEPILDRISCQKTSIVEKLEKLSIETAGKCTEMCPKDEVHFRKKNHLIHPMETDSPFTPTKRSERVAVLPLMVKEYSRPAADKKILLKNVRNYQTLVKTVEYLIGLLHEHDKPEQWTTIYPFICDRFRAIRQDMIVQQVSPEEIVALIEPMIPFYLVGRMRCDCFIRDKHFYDKRLHSSEVDECFSRWIEAAKTGVKVNEDVIRAYVYYYLDNDGAFDEILKTFGFTAVVEELIRLGIGFANLNYCQFFRVYKAADKVYLKAALWIHSGALRVQVLQSFRAVFGMKGLQFPVNELTRILGYKSEQQLVSCLKSLFVIEGAVAEPFTFANLVLRTPDLEKLALCWFDDDGSWNGQVMLL